MLVFVAGLALVAFAVPATLGVRDRLEEGRRALEQARADVVAGDTGRALDRFRAASFDFDEAAGRSETGVLGIARVLPFVGENIDVVHALAVAGSDTAQAGIDVAGAVRSLPGGMNALAPTNGRIPLERFSSLATALARAHRLVADATSRVSSTSSSLLLPSVETARWQAQTSLGDLEVTLGSAATFVERLPAFLGEGGPKTYLFGAENPAELRGTGGLIGAYALLTAENGKLQFSSFLPVQQLPMLDLNTLPAPNPDYRRLYYPQRGGKGFWLNVNMTPDFPSAARALETAYEAATGKHVDGVVTADPFALRALLQTTGPARVRSLGVRVTAASVVSLLANRAYAQIDEWARGKLVLGDVARTVVVEFLHDADAARSVRAIGDAAAEGHVMVYSDDPQLESALAMTGAGGAFRPRTGSPSDLLSVVANNGAANKVDYYIDRDVRYVVTLDEGGGAHADTEVRLTNHAPKSGLPAYVLGPNNGVTDKPGQAISILNVYCGECTLSRATRDGAPFDAGVDHELSSNFFQDYVRMDSGATTTTRFDYRVSSVWAGDSSGGTYRLRFLNQPTIRPTRLEVEIRVPDGMSVTDASPGVRVAGPVARWSGTPSHMLTIDIAFAPPLPQRLWREIVS
ncbi:MAG: DUF4012 domain-containing protein [Actinomycetota bacterium]